MTTTQQQQQKQKQHHRQQQYHKDALKTNNYPMTRQKQLLQQPTTKTSCDVFHRLVEVNKATLDR